MRIRLLGIFAGILLFNMAKAQMKAHLIEQANQTTHSYDQSPIRIQSPFAEVPQAQNRPLQGLNQFPRTMGPLYRPGAGLHSLRTQHDPLTGMPVFIKGMMEIAPLDLPGRSALENQCLATLEAIKEVIKIHSPSEEFLVRQINEDKNGDQHIRMQQQYQGVKIYGAELVLHSKNEKIEAINGRWYPSPEIEDVVPRISAAAALQIVRDDVARYTRLTTLTDQQLEWLGEDPEKIELVIYHHENDLQGERLAWSIEIIPNISARRSYLVDARDGAILHQHNKVCQFYHGPGLNNHNHDHVKAKATLPTAYSVLPPDGPREAEAADLFGTPRTIHTYEKGSLFFMIDASRDMHIPSQSSFPNEAVGVIMTIDATNTAPQNDDFNTIHVTSDDNNWDNSTAVSAHYNAGEAYRYFEDTHGRNSINGQGGNIISFINVVEEDGNDMDNAFWNGAFMFYGNGDVAFTDPLSKALDVTGHELTHGVVQNTANLEYMGESGAINESMADVFGAMIDRNDWQMGEDVANSSVFSSGALRDMLNPHNGGNSLNDPGYQPDHTSEQFFGSEDNGGVHINSGIPNKAFALLANNIGKAKAEEIYYHSLVNYLVRSSRFVDLRLAILESAANLYGSTEVNAVAAAFDAVGIAGGQGGDYQEDIEQNPGEEFILFTDGQFSSLYIETPAGDAVADPLTSISPLSKPSITDDGSFIVYVADDKTLRTIFIDWANSQSFSDILSSDPMWRNAAISKDGDRLAALTDDFDNRILIFDLTQSEPEGIPLDLYNPTFADGVETGDVQYADILEWDVGGEFLMYDALNRVSNTSGNIEYWDIGFIRAWNNGTNNLGDGFISKLFSGLPENTSVGNPTFSKNSPHIIALDYIDEFNNEYFILGANIQTGDVGTIFQNNDLGYPNYSVQDNQLIFDAFDNLDNRVIGITNLNADKITPSGNPSVFIGGGFDEARWGLWFASGVRTLVAAEEVFLEGSEVKVYPNPTQGFFNLEVGLQGAEEVQIALFDLLGRQIMQSSYEGGAGAWTKEIHLPEQLQAGTYLLRVSAGEEVRTVKVLKE